MHMVEDVIVIYRDHEYILNSLPFRALIIKAKVRLFLVPDRDIFKLTGLYSYAVAHLH